MKKIAGSYYFGILGFVVALGCGLGCGPNDKGITFMPDMAYSPATKGQEQYEHPDKNRQTVGMFKPVPGTVARGMVSYPYKGDPEAAGRNLRNTLPRTKHVIEEGGVLFSAYCRACHGPLGQGDGSVTPMFPRPPSLTSAKVRDYSDGRIFHIITEGQNLMPSYATQVEPQERWAIIHYVRTLYRSQHPSSEDLKKVEKW